MGAEEAPKPGRRMWFGSLIHRSEGKRLSSGYVGECLKSKSLLGGSCKKEGSGEQEEARDKGLLSNEAFVRDGVGGSCDTSLSDGTKSGDKLRSEGGGEECGEDEGESGCDWEGSSNGRKAKRGFWRFSGGLAAGRWLRCGGCQVEA